MIYDIQKNEWSDELLNLFDIPKSILPEVKDSADNFGTTTSLEMKLLSVEWQVISRPLPSGGMF